MNLFFYFSFVLLIAVVGGTSECSSYEFECEDGECIDSGLWCDSHEDCIDGTDEKYCKKSGYFDKDPNKCPKAYFKCKNGPCIPQAGRCDSYNHCEDESDEKDCEEPEEVGESEDKSPQHKHSVIESDTKTTESTNVHSTTRQSPVNSKHLFTNDFKVSQHTSEIVYSDLESSDYLNFRAKAREWLLSQRDENFGWREETPRAITALYLSDAQRSVRRNETDLLMTKQLEVQLALNIARNGTKAMELTDLALYINALVVSCKDPKNFYGENLVSTLRNGVNSAQRGGLFVNPSVYLTLCLNNATTYDDTRKLHDLHFSRHIAIGRLDIQALTLLTTTCIYRNTKLLSTSMHDGLKMQFLHRMNTSGFPGNVYEAALLFQALQELKVSIPGLLDSILKTQQEDGSFGGILATYLVLPVLSGESFLQINTRCSQRYITDPAPIAVLQNMKRRKIDVRYSLKNGIPAEITQTIEMQVAEGINFLDVMRLAQEINPKYRFKLDGNLEIPVVYSIGGIPNDAEKGLFWTLHLVSNGNRISNDAGRLNLQNANIKQLIPHAGDEYIFWMRSI